MCVAGMNMPSGPLEVVLAATLANALGRLLGLAQHWVERTYCPEADHESDTSSAASAAAVEVHL